MSMKKLFVILLTLVTFGGIVNAQSYDISLRWSNNPPIQMVSKYIVHQATGTSTNFIPVVTANGTNFAKVRVNSPNTYKFKIQAVNGVTNSPLSSFVQVPQVPPTTPAEPEVLSIEVK